MSTETGTHTTAVHRPLSSVAFYATLHLAVGVGIFFLIRESLPKMRTDIQVLISGLAGILGAGFLRTWTSDTPEETFMCAMLAALLAFVSYISIYLFMDSMNVTSYLKMVVYSIIAAISGGLSLFALYHLLFGGHRRSRR